MRKLVKLKIKDIKPYENNPRDNDAAVDVIRRSIEEYGYVNPIVVDEDNIVLAGHTRLKALIELDYEEVSVIIVEGLSDTQKKAYRIADNKTSEISKWDRHKLIQEFNEVPDDLLLSDLFPNINAQLKSLDLPESAIELDIDDMAKKWVDKPAELIEIECEHCQHKFKVDKIQ